MAVTEKQFRGETAELVEDQGNGTHYRLVKVVGGGGGGSSVTQYAEDTAHVSGDLGMMMLAIRSDSDVPTAGDGDYTALKLDEAGRLKVASQPASYLPTTGNIGAVGNTVFVDCQRFSNLMIHCSGVFSTVNVVFEGSLDSTTGTDGNWFAVQAVRSNANTIETASGNLSAAPAYAWELSVNALKYFRVRATAWSSGSQGWVFVPGTYATEPIPAAQITGAQSVTLAALPAIVGQGAASAAAAGNAVRVGSRVLTAADTTLVAGDAVDHTATTAGQVLVKPGGLTESAWNANLALATTAAVALAAAGGAGLKRHITGLQAINTGAAAVDLIVLDGAAERWRMTLPVNVPVSFSFGETHLVTTVNAALNASLSAAGTVRVCAQGYTAP